MNLVNINIERPNFDKTNSSRNIEVMNRWISDTSDKLNYLIALINSGEIGGAVESDHGFDSSDTKDGNASEWTNVEPLKSGEKDRSILEKISRMFRNVRYLFKVMGNTDISSIGGGTATGAINYLKQNLEKQSEKIGSLNADLAKQHPIGSVYISFDSADPGTLYGGTWERLKDVFLLAAGDTYAAGSTGGEASHTLTVDEMPSHRHASSSFQNGYATNASDTDKYCTWVNYGTANNNNDVDGQSGPIITSHVGGSQPHNNMPPYITAYMWRRVA